LELEVQAMSQAWKASDLLRMEAVGEPQLSPDGKHVAYVVQKFDQKKDKAVTQIWIADVDGGDPRRLTSGPSDRSPRWAPDGHRIAFISERSGKPQIWVIDIRGGEAWQVVTEQRVESPPVWSPDGTRLAFVSRAFAKGADWVPYPGAPEEDRDRARRAAEQALKEDKDGKDKDQAPPIKVITEMTYRFDGVGYFGDLKRHIFVVTLPDPEAAMCGQQPAVRQVTWGDWHHQDPTWSPDGRFLAFTGLRKEPEYEDYFRTDLWQVELATGEMSQVLRAGGPILCPVWSPDGRWLAYIGHHQAHGRSTTQGLWVVPMKGPRDRYPLSKEDTRNLTAELDRPVGSAVPSDVRYGGFMVAPPVWSADGRSVYFLAADRGVGKLYRVEVEDGRPEELLGSRDCSVAAFHVVGDCIAYQAGSDRSPDQIFVRTSQGSPRQVTDANTELLRQLPVSPAEHFTYQGADGWEIDAWLVKPPNFEQEKKYPLVLMIHGGPHGIYGHAFMFAVQHLASNGFVVLYTNPRGSQSYGQEFASAVVGDWGGKDYQDLMAGVDAVLEQGFVDPQRMGVTGWSYGGYMTNWIITQTTRFAAAVTGACVFNLHNFYGTSDIGFTFGEFQWQGRPWDEPEKLLRHSPVSGVERVQTPVLILHGESDLRCPVEQAEQLFMALKRLGKTAVMVRYPGEFHALRRPSYRVDRYHRMLKWFQHYLAG